MSLVFAWTQFFALTLAVELCVCVPLLGARYPISRRLAAVGFAQLASTLPFGSSFRSSASSACHTSSSRSRGPSSASCSSIVWSSST